MAVISVSCNKTLPYLQDEEQDNVNEFGRDDGILTNTVNSFLKKNDQEFLTNQDRADFAAEQIALSLSEIAGIEVVSKETVLESEGYKNLSTSLLSFISTKIRATGYKELDTVGSKAGRMLMNDLGAKSLLICDFRFYKSLVRGNKFSGKIAGYVIMTVKLFNEKGKLVLNKEYDAETLDKLDISTLKYDKDALVELYPPLIENVLTKFALEFVN